MRRPAPFAVALLAAAASGLVVAAAVHAQTPQPAGPEFVVNAFTAGNQSTSRIAVEPDGDFVLVWTSAGQDGSGDGIFARRYFADGTPRGPEFRVNTYTTGHQNIASVAVGANGAFDVVWASEQDGSYQGIYGQRYDATATRVGSEFQINTYTTLGQSWPQIARAPDGRFVVAWLTVGQDGSGWGVAARRFDPAGNPLGADFVVNSFTTDQQWEQSVAVDTNGNFVVVWRDHAPGRDGSGWGVFGQRFDAAGNRLGGDFVVNTTTVQDQFSPSVALDPAGGFVVAFGSRYYGGDVYTTRARRFDAAGNGIGNDFQVPTYTTGRQDVFDFGGTVTVDPSGHFVVVWQNMPDGTPLSSDIMGQRFDPSGNKVGAEFSINESTTGWQDGSTVSADASGNFVVTWLDRYGHDGSGWGNFARRFRPSGLEPVALEMDPAAGPTSNGNAVWEPGEQVEMRPSWRNATAAAQPVAATLAALTGPPAAYSIADGAGDYGTLPAGGSGSCTDCYAVAVDDPSPRPSPHWDATVRESLGGAAARDQQWILHLGRSFVDVPPSGVFYRFVETLLHNEIVSGCSPTDYCPALATARDQMAVFVLVAKEGIAYLPPPCSGAPRFVDVPVSNPFCRWIEELARRGVVSGCGGGNYCPTHEVSREQMAVFVLRTLDPALTPPACGAPVFADVPPTSVFCRWIEELARRGVVTGCGGGNYCPTDPVTREQMGVFMTVTFGLTLYGP